MTLGVFQEQLKKLHPDFYVLAGSPTDQTAGVFFKNERLFTIPNINIYDHPIDSYGVETSTGFIRHRTTKDAIAMAKKLLQDMKNNHDEYEATMGLGKYSAKNLKEGNEKEEWEAEQAYIKSQKQTKGGIILP